MAKVNKILFAMELSELSAEIVGWVNLMVQQFEAEMHVQHVIPDLDFFGVAYAVPPGVLDDQGKLIANAEKQIYAFCDKWIDKEITPKVKVSIGNPAEEIIKYINSERISIVVIGTHGRSGLDRSIFGSVADRVLRFSPVPVLCINPHPQELEE